MVYTSHMTMTSIDGVGLASFLSIFMPSTLLGVGILGFWFVCRCIPRVLNTVFYKSLAGIFSDSDGARPGLGGLAPTTEHTG